MSLAGWEAEGKWGCGGGEFGVVRRKGFLHACFADVAIPNPRGVFGTNGVDNEDFHQLEWRAKQGAGCRIEGMAAFRVTICAALDVVI